MAAAEAIFRSTLNPTPKPKSNMPDITLTPTSIILARTKALESSPNGACPVEYDQEICPPVAVGVDANEAYGQPDPAHND